MSSKKKSLSLTLISFTYDPPYSENVTSCKQTCSVHAFEIFQMKFTDIFWVNGSFTEHFYKNMGLIVEVMMFSCVV